MSDWIVYALYLIGVAGTLVFGISAVLFPEKSIKLRDRMINADQWSKANFGRRPGSLLSWRLAGLLAVALAMAMLKPIVSAVIRIAPVVRRENLPAHRTGGPNWFAFGVGLVMILGGAYVLIQPERLLNWGVSRLPHRSFDENAMRRGRSGAQIMGGLAIVAGALAVYAWFNTVR